MKKYHIQNTLQQKQSRQELHNKCTPQDKQARSAHEKKKKLQRPNQHNSTNGHNNI
jgi:hypothetical protein